MIHRLKPEKRLLQGIYLNFGRYGRQLKSKSIYFLFSKRPTFADFGCDFESVRRLLDPHCSTASLNAGPSCHFSVHDVRRTSYSQNLFWQLPYFKSVFEVFVSKCMVPLSRKARFKGRSDLMVLVFMVLSTTPIIGCYTHSR